MFKNNQFQLSLPKRIEIKTKINKNAEVDWLYAIELTLAAVLATLGLLQNSVAVVIGAMLVAPLFRPIQALALAITLNNWERVLKHAAVLFVSTIGGIAVGYVFTWLLPNSQQTSEILSRTAPNLLDLVVALASAVVVFLALKSKRLLDSVAGVAMAAALLPPLTVIGIELALNQFSSAKGAMLLYLTNIVAIILIGVIILYLFGFDPRQRGEQVRSKVINLAVLIVLTIMIAIPLSTSLIEITQRTRLQQQATQIITEVIQETIPQSALNRIEITALSDHQASLKAYMSLTESEQLFTETKEQLLAELGQKLEKDIELTFELVRVAEIVSEANYAGATGTRNEKITNVIATNIPEATVLTISQNPQDQNLLTILVSLPPGTTLPASQQELLTKKINTATTQSYQITWLTITESRAVEQTGPTPVELQQQTYLSSILTQINDLMPEAFTIVNVQLQPEFTGPSKSLSTIQQYVFALELEYPQNQERQLSQLSTAINQLVQDEINKPVQVDIKAKAFQSFSF